MLVTIFTDAGLCPNTKVASWASWAKSKRGLARAGGIFRDAKHNSTESEACAAINGIHNALAQRVAAPGDTIIVQTDNNGVEAFLTGPMKANCAARQRRIVARKAYQDITAKHELQVTFRHVKGHRGAIDKRSAVNTWCDQVCSFFLAMARHDAAPDRFKKPNREKPYGI